MWRCSSNGLYASRDIFVYFFHVVHFAADIKEGGPEMYIAVGLQQLLSFHWRGEGPSVSRSEDCRPIFLVFRHITMGCLFCSQRWREAEDICNAHKDVT
jgi:hypothetical protein